MKSRTSIAFCQRPVRNPAHGVAGGVDRLWGVMVAAMEVLAWHAGASSIPRHPWRDVAASPITRARYATPFVDAQYARSPRPRSPSRIPEAHSGSVPITSYGERVPGLDCPVHSARDPPTHRRTHGQNTSAAIPIRGCLHPRVT